MSSPILPRGKVVASTDSYARLLDRELPREASPRSGLTLASFFCCGGGIDLGFRSAGFETVFANDVHGAAAETFEANLGHRPLLRDVREVGPSDYPPGQVDVVTGGFPCVTFSMAGRRAGVTDDENGKLYLELCRVITELRPRYFVAENVRGMLSANGGNAIKLVLAAFLRLGYRTSYELVNMAEHGVPQTRERVIFVGVRVDQWRGSFVFPPKTHRLRGDKKAKAWLPVARSLIDAIGDLPPPGERVVGMMAGDADRKRRRGRRADGLDQFNNSRPRAASATPHAQTTDPNVLILGARNPDFFNQLRGASEPSPTMTSGGATEVLCRAPADENHERNDAPVSPTYQTSKRRAKLSQPSPTQVSEAANVVSFVERDDVLRRMTVRECARVQSFPDWYEFRGSQADGYRIVGNAVPPLYAKRLALALLEYDKREIVR